MNIFYLSHDPATCAQYHVDKHVVKMILEYSQLLSTAHRVLDGKECIEKSKTNRNVKRWKLSDSRDSILYSATHVNHPSAIWARRSNSNYKWLYSLLVACCEEYTFRYGRVHKCEYSGLVEALGNLPNSIVDGKFTEPTPAMPEEYIITNDMIKSYRNYYLGAKSHMFSWKGGNVPNFIANNE